MHLLDRDVFSQMSEDVLVRSYKQSRSSVETHTILKHFSVLGSDDLKIITFRVQA